MKGFSLQRDVSSDDEDDLENELLNDNFDEPIVDTLSFNAPQIQATNFQPQIASHVSVS